MLSGGNDLAAMFCRLFKKATVQYLQEEAICRMTFIFIQLFRLCECRYNVNIGDVLGSLIEENVFSCVGQWFCKLKPVEGSHSRSCVDVIVGLLSCS